MSYSGGEVNSNMSEEEKENIKVMFETIKGDYLLHLSRSKTNKTNYWESEAEYWSGYFMNSKNLKEGVNNRQTAKKSQVEDQKGTKKNVSFAEPVNFGGYSVNSPTYGNQNEYEMNDVDASLNQSNIHYQVDQEDQQSMLNDMHQSFLHPNEQSKSSRHRADDNSHLWANTFGNGLSSEVNYNIDVYEEMMQYMIAKNYQDETLGNLQLFKAKVLSRRHPIEILKMYSDIETSRLQGSYEEFSNISIEERTFNQDEVPENETCPICFEPFSDNGANLISEQQKAVAFEKCYHMAHFACIVNYCIADNKNYPPICPLCRNDIAKVDIEFIDEWVYKNFKFNSLLDYINSKK